MGACIHPLTFDLDQRWERYPTVRIRALCQRCRQIVERIEPEANPNICWAHDPHSCADQHCPECDGWNFPPEIDTGPDDCPPRDLHNPAHWNQPDLETWPVLERS